MPELREEMYCSQQICIPPAFPYLLRQYAKAAIRTQPTDLLKWSTAYFRCLALNLPPPVKPRLEYPIPLDYNGLTPGWLRALANQMPNVQTVSFKLLWDRWIGACLKHTTLIEILLLGKFTNNQAIPWWKFLALCAGHLTENLTHTMIMVCEILTEEPEGGSAMIPLKAFMDIYRFLADIDASKPQHLPNIYFTDSVLGLCVQEEEDTSTITEIFSEKLIAIEQVEEVEEAVAAEKVDQDMSVVVSCPDIAAEEAPDEPLGETAFPPKGTEVLPENIDKTFALGQDGSDQGQDNELSQLDLDGVEEPEEIEEINATELERQDSAEKDKKSPREDSDTKQEKVSPKEDKVADSMPNVEEDKDDVEHPQSPLNANEDVKNVGDSAQQSKDDVDGKKELSVDSGGGLAGQELSVVTVQEDTTGRFEPKERPALPDHSSHITEEIEVSVEEGTNDKEAPEVGDTVLDTEKRQDNDETKGSGDISFDESVEGIDVDIKEDKEVTNMPRYEWFDIPVVLGIGPTVPIELVEIVHAYMTKMAKVQHGVVMPKNIRHFACPPLEVFDLQDE